MKLDDLHITFPLRFRILPVLSVADDCGHVSLIAFVQPRSNQLIFCSIESCPRLYAISRFIYS